MLAVITYLSDSFKELTERVTWPSYEQVQEIVYQFIIGVILLTLLISIINIYIERILQWLYSYFI